jgi:uncharacterized membrane protein
MKKYLFGPLAASAEVMIFRVMPTGQYTGGPCVKTYIFSRIIFKCILSLRYLSSYFWNLRKILRLLISINPWISHEKIALTSLLPVTSCVVDIAANYIMVIKFRNTICLPLSQLSFHRRAALSIDPYVLYDP